MSPRRLSAPLAAYAAVVAALLAGCGGGGGGGSVDVGPAAAVPQNAALYLDARVKPTGSAQANAKAALSKILNTSDPGGEIVSLIEKQSKADGHPINYQRDIAPWLGEKAGVFLNDLSGQTTEGTVVIEATNPAAALAAVRKGTGTTATDPAPQSYNGVPYQSDPTEPGNFFGTVGDFLVEGDLAGFKAAVDASKGDSLGDSSDFEDAVGDLPSDRLGTIYTVPKDLIAAVGSGQIDEQSQSILEKSAGDSLNQPVAGAVTASADTIELEASGGSSGVETPQSSLIGEVPGQAWLAVGAADLGGAVNRGLDQFKDIIPNFNGVVQQIETTTGASLDQLTGSLGDAVLYVQGTTESTLTGALVVQSKDPDLTGRLLSQLQGLLQLGTGGIKPLHISGGGTGFQINDQTLAPRPVELAQQGDKVVIGYGAGSAEQSLAPAQKLSDSPVFSAAQGKVSALGTDLFLDFPSVFRVAESSGAKSDPDYVRAKPYLNSLSYLVSGSGTENDKTEIKAILGLR
ncbi:MAG TPA: DUF3352 domain-containing protein [Solirubrobacterales bacterium]